MPILRLLALLLLASCGGGGSPDTPRAALQLAPEIALTGHAIVPFADTGKRAGTRLSLRFTVTFEDYFRCVPDGHAGVMLNAAVERLPAGPYVGDGVIFGSFGASETTRNLPQFSPLAVAQIWFPGTEALAVSTVRPLQDWTPYEFELHADPGHLGYSINGRGAGEVDSPVPMRPEIVFFDTGGGVCPYVIRISNPTATWSEP